MPMTEARTRKAYFCPECSTEMIPGPNAPFLIHVESTDCAPDPWPDLLSVWTVVIPDGNCDRHGGPWGEDKTCPRCTFLDGSVRPADEQGPLAEPELPITDNLVFDFCSRARSAGYAITAFTPEELRGVDPFDVTDVMVAAGNNHIGDYATIPEEGDDE